MAFVCSTYFYRDVENILQTTRDVVAIPVARDETDVARLTMRRVGLRLLPLLFVLFVCNYIDRTNIAMAKLQMNRDLGFTETAYALGASIFFIG